MSCLSQDLFAYSESFQKNWVEVCSTFPETLPLFETKLCDFSYPISDLIKNLIPYFRPEALEPGAWLDRVTSCYSTYTVVDINITREMASSPNDEQVADSSKKHTQFKTRVHKPWPISDQNDQKTIPLSTAHSYIAYKRNSPTLPPPHPPHPRSEQRVADCESRCLRKRD